MSSGAPGQPDSLPRGADRKRGGSRFKKFITADPEDDLGGARSRDDFETTWNYTPRPRRHPDRGVRSSPWHVPVPDERRKSSEPSDRRSAPSAPRITRSQDSGGREGNGYVSEGKRSLHGDAEWDSNEDFAAKLSTQPLKPLKEIPEFQMDVRIRDGLVDSSQPQNLVQVPPQAEQQLVMVVTDEGSCNQQLSEKQVKIVQKKLTRKLMKAFETGTGVQFETQHYDGQYLKYTCANQESCEWLKSAVGSLRKLWEGAALKVLLENDLPRYVRVTAFIPGKEITQEKCQTALAAQNPQLGIAKWVIWEFTEASQTGGFDAVFGVPDEFIGNIESAKGQAYFMFSKITLNISHDNGKNVK